MKKTKKIKKKLSLGDYLVENQAPLTTGAVLAGQTIQGANNDTNTASQVAGTALSRAGQFGKLGASFGPEGAAIGAGIGIVEGGIEGAFNAKAAQQRKQKQNTTTNAVISSKLINNAGMAEGGRLASKLGVIQGGELHTISPDAVEVKANNPEQTDSVELDSAYVDHNEIIDDKNRVFSDELGFAKAAKRLEKQKSKYSRFNEANQHIDDKLDELFQLQEQTKEGMKQGAKTKKAKGGYLTLTGPFPMKPIKKRFEDGGEDLLGLGSSPYIPKINQGLHRLDATEDNSSPSSVKSTTKVNTNQGLTDIATFLPNVVSQAAQNRLVGPAAPGMESAKQLQRVMPDSQLAQIDTEANNTNQLVRNNVGQSGNLTSSYGDILAKRLQARNSALGQNQQINAGIQHNEAQINTGIGARNAQRYTEFANASRDFSNLKQRLTTENVANLSSKILQQQREKNMERLDRDKFAFSSLAYRDSGVRGREWNELKKTSPDAYKSFEDKGLIGDEDKLNKAEGGMLSNREIHSHDMLSAPYMIRGLYQKTEPHNAWAFESNEEQNLQSIKERSKGGKANHKLAKGGYVGGGETPNDPKKPSKPSVDDFKRISWRSQGLMDSVGRGSMYSTTYNALNRLNNTPIPAGVDPNSQTFVTNPMGLNQLLNQAKPAYDISGSVAPQAGRLAHFSHGGEILTLEGLGDPRHMRQASESGPKEELSKGGIHIKKSHRGLLHKNLGVPQGKKIPKSKLVVHSGDSPALKKRKIFAQNFGHKK